MIAKLFPALIIILVFGCGCIQPATTTDETVRSSRISPVQSETILHPFSIPSAPPLSTQEQAAHINGSVKIPFHVFLNGPSAYKNWETIFLSGTGPRNQTIIFSITDSGQGTLKLSPEKISPEGTWIKKIDLKDLSIAPGLVEISILPDTPNTKPSTVVLLIRS